RPRAGAPGARARRASLAAFLLGVRVDARLDRHAGPQVFAQRLIRVDGDAHADALRDLDEVAGGVVGLEHRELRAGGRGNALDAPRQAGAAERVPGEARFLARRHAPGLRLLEIGDHPEVRGHERQELRAVGDVLAEPHADLAHLTGLGGADHRVL